MKIKRPLILAFTLITSAYAFGQFKSGDNIVIADKVTDDLYVAAGTVTINAPIHGDLIVAGGTVNVNDTITQDILIAGGTLFLNGYVRDDVRCAGGTIKLLKNIEGDVAAAGGTINIDKGATVTGNLYVSGGEVTVDGNVNGFIKSASGFLALNGQVGRDIDCRGGKLIINGTVNGNSILAAPEIVLGSQAHFNNDVRYWNKDESLDFGNAISNGKATLDPSLKIESGKWHYLGFGSFLIALWYLGTALVMIALIQYLFSSVFRMAADTIKMESLKSVGVGFLFLVGVPVAVVICMITIVGLPVGILLTIGYISILLFATVIVALLAAHWINNTYYQGAWRSRKIVFAAFGIFIFLKLASLTPFAGPLVMLVLACMGFGGILQNVKWAHSKAPS